MTGAALDFARFRLEHIDSAGLDDLALLNPDEHKRLESISNPVRRRQFVAGRVLTQKLLATLNQHSPSDWTLQVSATGKPMMSHQPDVHLSISHTGEWVACAIASIPVGLDIERIDRKRSTDQLIEEVCSDEEQGLFRLLASGAREQLFTELWTLKEAWLKRRGEALDVSRMRAIRWTAAQASVGNCASWATAFGLSLTVLGPPAQSLLLDVPAALQAAPCTIRLVQDA